MKMIKLLLPLAIALFLGCSSDDSNGPKGESKLPEQPTDTLQEEEKEVLAISDEELLDLTQRETFKYFWDFAEANSGAARERYHPNEPLNDPNTVTIGGTGFGLMGILVGIERGFVTREEGVERLTQILGFLETADRFHGAWPHWLDGRTGQVLPFSELDDGGDLVETAFLVQGLICVTEYFKDGTDTEKALSEKEDTLWKGVEWNWYTQGEYVLYWHWSPNNDFAINLQLKGYNEILMTYIMAAASPDFSIEKTTYTNGEASNGAIASAATAYDIPLVVDHAGNASKGGPLFWAHYSYLGLNPNGLSDDFVNYGDATINHCKINYEYCVENPGNYADYGEDCWGLIASYTRNEDGSIGYNAHSPSNDTGVVSPTAVVSSIVYTPYESLEAMHYFYTNKDKLLGPAGF